MYIHQYKFDTNSKTVHGEQIYTYIYRERGGGRKRWVCGDTDLWKYRERQNLPNDF